MRLKWQELLSDFRTPYEGKEAAASSSNPHRSHFESDYDRVVFSQSFRRLARKTQVHPMAPDGVHNRLTHSIEVACVGRSFANRLAHFLQQRNEMPQGRSAQDLSWILMSACVAHDIGNPPFGHAGEYAIREWADSHSSEIFPDGIEVSEDVKKDILIFEGNAQGFRLASRVDIEHTGHLRLTFASLGAMVKYPWCSTDARAQTKQKYNCFSTEWSIFETVFGTMGLQLSDGTWARHPLSFLSEAADDICYRVLDLEDAAEIGIVSTDYVRDVYSLFLDNPRPGMPLSMMRGQVIQRLIDESWNIFETHYDQIMAGERNEDLKRDFSMPMQEGMKRVGETYEMIFADSSKVIVELGAYKSIGRIVKALALATQKLARHQDVGKLMFISKRCLELAWPLDFLKTHQTQPYEWWLHQILDYVGGLTDNYVQQLSREIEGI